MKMINWTNWGEKEKAIVGTVCHFEILPRVNAAVGKMSRSAIKTSIKGLLLLFARLIAT